MGFMVKIKVTRLNCVNKVKEFQQKIKVTNRIRENKRFKDKKKCLSKSTSPYLLSPFHQWIQKEDRTETGLSHLTQCSINTINSDYRDETLTFPLLLA